MIFLLAGLAVGPIYSLVALGFSLVYRATGLMNFAQGQFVAIGALIGVTFINGLGLPFLPALILSALTSALWTLLLERLTFRMMRKLGRPLLNQIIASIGLVIFLDQAATLVWGAQPLTYRSTPPKEIFHIMGFPIPLEQVFVCAVAVSAMTALHLFLKYTSLGRAMRAVADDPVIARMLGIRVNQVISLVNACNGALAAVAGMLLASLYYASYDLGSVAIKGFAAAVLGGLGNLPGAMIGGLILGVAESYGAVLVSSQYRDAIALGVLLAVLLIRPTGLLGVRLRKG